MKKLLTLVLVLSFASAASATLTYVDASDNVLTSISIVQGETATVYISSSDAVAYPASWMGGGAAATAEITAITAMQYTHSDTTLHNNAGNLAAVVDWRATYPGYWTVAGASNLDPTDMLAGKQWEVTISGIAEGSTSLWADEYGSAGDSSSLGVTVTPEPMTIALLGLGGLFLRRRK